MISSPKQDSRNSQPSTQQPNMPTLRSAIADGNITELKRLIQLGVNKEIIINDETPLCYAISRGEIEIAKELVYVGADVSALTYDESTPLHLAIAKGFIDLAKELVRYGADINAFNGCDEVPLSCAINAGATDFAIYLINKGACIEPQEEGDYPPIRYAISGENIDVVNRLIEMGVNVKEKYEDGFTSLHDAASLREGEAGSTANIDIIECLIKWHAEIDALDLNGETPLMLASQTGNARAMECLISYGAEIGNLSAEEKQQYSQVISAGQADFHERKQGVINIVKGIMMDTVHKMNDNVADVILSYYKVLNVDVINQSQKNKRKQLAQSVYIALKNKILGFDDREQRAMLEASVAMVNFPMVVYSPRPALIFNAAPPVTLKRAIGGSGSVECNKRYKATLDNKRLINDNVGPERDACPQTEKRRKL